MTCCSIDGCSDPVQHRGWCQMHYKRWHRHGDPLAVARSGRPRIHPAESPRSKRRYVRRAPVAGPTTYGGVHVMLRKTRGPASDQRCVDCDDQAFDWSYDGTDPGERESRKGLFSLDLDRYVPRCRRCHRRHDKQLRERTLV